MTNQRTDIRRDGEHALHEAGANATLMDAAPTLLAYYRASRRLQATLGHPDATAEDERAAEDAYQAAANAAAEAVRELSNRLSCAAAEGCPLERMARHHG